MTLSLNVADQFAAPFDVQPVEPPVSVPISPRINDGGSAGEPPSFLLRARGVADRNPNSAIAWAQRAQAAQAAGEGDEAVEAASRAIDLGVAQASAPATYAGIVVLSAYDRASVLRTVLDDPRSAELPPLVPLRAATELRDLETALRLVSGQTNAESLVTRAWLELQRHDYQAAVAASREARRLGAVGPALLTNLGFAHAALGNIDKAIAATRQAAVLSPLDRTIGFNLAGFYRAQGKFDHAVSTLTDLATGPRPDFQLALATAEIFTSAGDLERAHRILQSVRTSQEWAQADIVRRCELEANLALLRWTTNREASTSAVKAVLRALRSCDYQSVSIAYMLLNFLREPAEADVLLDVVAKLQDKHPSEALFPLRMHLGLLRRDEDETVTNAIAWTRHDVLNPSAASVALHFLTDLAGRPDAAAEMGLIAVKRSPAGTYVVNNTAYALALANRPAEALALLDSFKGPQGDEVVMTATCALAELMRGNLTEGVAGYRHARAIAEKNKDESLALRVDIHLALALNRVPTGAAEAQLSSLVPLSVPQDWARRTDFWIASVRARRELGATAEAWFPGLTSVASNS